MGTPPPGKSSSALNARPVPPADATGTTEDWKDVFFTYALDGMAVADTGSKCLVTANPAFCRMMGYTSDEIRGLPIQDIHPPEQLATVVAAFERQVAGGSSIARDTPMLRKDGSVFYADVNSSPVNVNGRPYLLGIFRDVTERNRSAEDLRQRTQELTALNTLNRAVGASLSLAQVISAALREMRQAIQTDLALLFLREGERLMLQEVEPDATHRHVGRTPEHRVGACLCGLAVRTGQPVFSKDIANDPRCTLDECKKAGYHSFAALPLLSGTEVIGVMGLASFTDRDFQEQERFLETLAGSVSAGIQNARLFAATQRAAMIIEDERQFSDTIIEGLPGVFYIFDDSGKFLRWNRNMETITGYSADEIARLHPMDFFKGSDREHIAERIQQVFKEGMANAEAHLVAKDGTVRPYYFTGIRIAFDEKPCLIGVGLDITERKQAEESLRQRVELQDQIARIAASVPGVICSFRLRPDGSACMPFASSALKEIYGMDPSAVAEDFSPIMRMLHADDAPQVWHAILESARTLDPWHAQFRVNSPEKGTIWVEGRSVPRREPDGSTLWHGFVFDITDRKRAEEALEHSEKFLRALSENLADGMVYQLNSGKNGEQRVFTYLSPVVETLHGLKVEDVKRDPSLLYNQFLDEDRKKLDQLEEHCAATRTPLDIVARVRLPSGEVRWRHFKSTPRLAPDGSVIWDGIEFDITERRQLEERLRQSEKLTAIGQLAGGIAHDFNNQLAGVMGYASLLEHRLEDGPLRRFAQGISVSARRAADLTQKLLAFSRKGKYLSVPVDIHRLLDEVVAILERSIDKRIHITQVLRAHHPVVLGDPTQIQNALLNLALNARDAMPQGGNLTFKTDTVELPDADRQRSAFDPEPGAYLCIDVSDTGCGMSDDVRRHLFEPFFTTKDVGSGTGMGLASVYGTIQSHKGTISVSSEPNRGSTFRICLPLAPGTAPSEQAKTGIAPKRGSATVLLVDDERIVREMVSDILRDMGYRVTLCADGLEAVTYYREHWREVDLVILDMVMPGMNGRETFLAMRRINPSVRALLSSGYSLDNEAQAILEEGVLAFVGKPYQQSELAQKIEEALAQPPETEA